MSKPRSRNCSTRERSSWEMAVIRSFIVPGGVPLCVVTGVGVFEGPEGLLFSVPAVGGFEGPGE